MQGAGLVARLPHPLLILKALRLRDQFNGPRGVLQLTTTRYNATIHLVVHHSKGGTRQDDLVRAGEPEVIPVGNYQYASQYGILKRFRANTGGFTLDKSLRGLSVT